VPGERSMRMRPLLALELFVCLTGGCFGDDLATPEKAPSIEEWRTSHETGVKAFRGAAYAEALAAFQQCWQLSQMPVARGITANDIASTLHALGRESEARPWFERALETWLALPGHADQAAHVALGLADADRGLSDFAGAEKALRSAMADKPSPTLEAALKNRLADMLREQGRNEESRRQLAEALKMGKDSPSEQIRSLIGIAELERQAMRWDESVVSWNKALAIARQQHDTDSEALALRGLGVTAMNRGNLAEAEPLLRRSLRIFESIKDTPPQQMANALQCVAAIYFERNRPAVAEELFRRGLVYLQNSVGEEHPHAARLMEELAEVYAAEKRFAEARGYADRAYSIMRRNFGEDSVPAGEALGTIARIRQQAGDLPGAAVDYGVAIRTLRDSQSSTGQGLVVVMNRYASVLNALHRRREAKEIEAEIKTFRED
jgi:tetratricopeptide (TPR) repeat protein